MALKGRDAGESWFRFINQYEPMLLAWARKRGLDDTLAQEAVSDVYLKLIEQLPKFVYDPDRRFRSWLRTILEHAIVDMHRRQARMVVVPNEKMETHWALHSSEHSDPPEEFFEGIERRIKLANQIVRAVQGRVNKKTWQAFFRTEVQCVSGVDVARELTLSEGAVYTARFRVRAMLRRELQNRQNQDGDQREF